MKKPEKPCKPQEGDVTTQSGGGPTTPPPKPPQKPTG